MSGWEIYWITRLDYFHGACIFGMILLLLGWTGGIIVWAMESEISDTPIKERVLKIYGVCTTVLLFIFIGGTMFIPTTKEFLAIKSISYVTQNEKVLTTGDKLFEAVDKYLNEYLKETNTEGE